MSSIVKKLYFNGNIVSMDAADSHPEAVLVAGDRIEAVGDAASLRKQGGPNLEEVDLAGKTLYPGFIDTHSHVDLLAAWAQYAYCGGTATLAEALDILKQLADSNPDAPVVMGYGFDDTVIAEQRGPSVDELDRIFGNRPVVLVHITIHMAYVNTAMFRLLGIATDKPSDDIDVFCENGRPTGTIAENMCLRAIGTLPPITPETLRDGLVEAMRRYNAQGITSNIGGGLGLSGMPVPLVVSALGELEKEGRMSVRCHLPIAAPKYDEIKATGMLDGPGTPYVRYHGLKVIGDGSIQIFTAAVPEGYLTRPEVKPEPIVSQEAMDAMVLKAHEQGQQVIAHGNGPGAIERIILAMERAQAKCPRKDPHHMLIHCQMASDSQLARMKAVGLEPSFFALHVWNWGDRHKTIFLGPERTARIDPAGSAVRLGMPVSFHADTPVLPQMTMLSIHTAVNRISRAGEQFGPDQCVSALEAMRGYTTYAAAMCQDAANRGSIEPGKYADLVCLDKDPRTVDPMTIKDIRILATISGGRTVWQA